MNRLRQFVTTIGRARLVMLVILIVLTSALGWAWQKYLLPEQDNRGAERTGLQSEQRQLALDIEALPSKYEALAKNEVRYLGVLETGFVGEQNRIVARTRLDNLRAEAGLRGIRYNIEPQQRPDRPQDYALQKDLIQTKFAVDFRGLTDLEIRDFLSRMRESFGGLVVTRAVELERDADLNETQLLQLSQQRPVDFVKGKVDFDWYTLVPRPLESAAPQAEAFGGQPQ